MQTAPLVLAVLGAVSADSTLDFGVRAEGRGGLVRAIDAPTPVPTADMRVSPLVEGGTRLRGFDIAAGYQPDLNLRASFAGGAPLVFHRARGRLHVGQGRGPHLDLGVGLAAGDVDFTVANEELESPFGLASQGGVVSLTAIVTTATISHRPTDEFDYGLRLQLQTLGTPTAYEDEVPPLQSLPRVEAYGNLLVGRFDQFQLVTSVHGAWPFLLAVVPRTPRLHPAYVGTQPELRWSHTWTRTLRSTVRGGALFAYQRTGHIIDDGTPIVFPVTSVMVADRRRAMRWASVTTGLTVGVSPLYDPFLVGLTERFYVQLGNEVELGRMWSIESTAQYMRLVASVVPTVTRAAESDDQITGVSTAIVRHFSKNWHLEGGGFAGLRIDDRPGGAYLAPQLVLYLAVTAGFGLDA